MIIDRVLFTEPAPYGDGMSILAFDEYLNHLERESARFREVLAKTDPTAQVPHCPDWRAADLLWHLGETQHFWGTIVAQRPVGPDELTDPTRPSSYDDLLAFFDGSSAALVTALRAADPTERAWTWSEDNTVGFIYRRQAHEALIHRLDAEQTAGDETPLDPTLASDGVLEVVDVMFGGYPPWGEFAPLEHYVRIDVTDTGRRIWAQLGRFTGTDPKDGVDYDEPGVRVVSEPGAEADAVVEGPAGPLDAWLWRRDDDSRIRVHGDKAAYDRFRLAVNHPII